MVVSCIDFAGQSQDVFVLLLAGDFFFFFQVDPMGLGVSFGLQNLRNKNMVDMLSFLALGKEHVGPCV